MIPKKQAYILQYVRSKLHDFFTTGGRHGLQKASMRQKAFSGCNKAIQLWQRVP